MVIILAWRKLIKNDDEKDLSIKEKILARTQDTTSPEDISYHVWSWWVLLVTVLITGTLIIIVSLSNPKFLLLGLLTLIATPVIAVYCLLMLIPKIKVFGFTVFDPKRLSARKRFSVGKTIAKTMGREFIRQSPEVALFIFFIAALFVVALVMALV